MCNLSSYCIKRSHKFNFAFLFSLLLISNGIAQCPENIFGFGTQAEVDNFVNMYPNCENAYVFVIAGDDITDLSPLSYIDRIQHIDMHDANNITSLLAFDNTEITVSLSIRDCNGLSSLDGTHLSDDFFSWLILERNAILENITALDDLDIGIETVTIMDNPNLSQCSVKRICQSLILPDAIIMIENNDDGCNSKEEVEIECEIMGLNDFELTKKIILFPNPTSNTIELLTSPEIYINEIKLYNLFGKQINTASKKIIDITHLAKGVYFAKISTNMGNISKKIIKK